MKGTKEETLAVMEILAVKGKSVKRKDLVPILGTARAHEFICELFIGRGAAASDEIIKTAATKVIKTMRGE